MGSLSAVARLRLRVSPVPLLELQYPTRRLCYGCFPIPPHHDALCSPQCGELEVHIAWDTQWQVSAHSTGVAAGSRNMLPSQILLMCSEPLSFLPTLVPISAGLFL